MSLPRLAYMANQIAQFFASEDRETAAASTADHLRKFWDPRMRRGIVTQLQAGQAHLDPPVRRAVERLAQEQSV